MRNVQAHGDAVAVEVSRIAVDEWDRLRDIRLEALAEAPLAFITTHEEALAYPDQRWRDLAAKGASGDGQATFLAVRGSETLGMAVGLWDPDRSGAVMPVVAVFVSRRARRGGVASMIMAAVHDWGRAKGALTASLWVVDDNVEARAFYESIGYRPTLDAHKITVPPERWETRFALDLS